MTENIKDFTNGWVDTDDAAELDEAFFQRADLYQAKKIVRRGRPPLAQKKQAIKLRIDADIISAFKATGKGWQTRMNAVLRANMPIE